MNINQKVQLMSHFLISTYCHTIYSKKEAITPYYQGAAAVVTVGLKTGPEIIIPAHVLIDETVILYFAFFKKIAERVCAVMFPSIRGTH